MEEEKEKLQKISKIVHEALRMLKMGEAATLSYNKEFTADALSEYIIAYAFHKSKWFKVKVDPVNQTLTALRSAPPPWPKEEVEPEPEEL